MYEFDLSSLTESQKDTLLIRTLEGLFGIYDTFQFEYQKELPPAVVLDIYKLVTKVCTRVEIYRMINK